MTSTFHHSSRPAPATVRCRVIVVSLFALSGASLSAAEWHREYFQQYVPFTPFIKPEQVSRDYLRIEGPSFHWKAIAPVPGWAEVMCYKEKINAVGELKNELEMKTGILPPLLPSIKDEPFKSPPSLQLGPSSKKPETVVPTDVWISPWINMSAPQPGDTSNQLTPNTSDTPPAFWLRRPTGEKSDVYIPFSSIPNVENPPPASSAVIYSQPEAGTQ